MGPVKSFLKDNDAAQEKKKAAQQALDIAMKMIQTRFRAFEAELNVPIGDVQKLRSKYLICYKKVLSVSVSESTKQNRDVIQGIVGDFSKGNIAKGITNVLFGALDMVLGTFSASYNESQDYIILTNELGGLLRIDYLVVMQKLEATGITTHISNAFGSYLIVSSVNKKEIDDDNVYRILVDRQFPSKDIIMKFRLVKLLQGQQLTELQLAELGQMVPLELQFDEKGNLKGKAAKPKEQKNKEGQNSNPVVKSSVPLMFQQNEINNPSVLSSFQTNTFEMRAYEALRQRQWDLKNLEDQHIDIEKQFREREEDLRQFVEKGQQRIDQIIKQKEQVTKDIRLIRQDIEQYKKQQIKLMEQQLKEMRASIQTGQ